MNFAVPVRTVALNRPITNRALDDSDSKESVRRRIVNLIFLVYWLLLFEGALRKWVFPQAWQYLFFIRDPFVLLIYFYCVKDRILPRLSPLLLCGAILIVAGSLIAFGDFIAGSVSPVVLAYGWRNYFLYFPLVFIIGRTFTFDDLNRLVKQTLLVAIPISALVVLQFLSPANASVNTGFVEGGLYQPGVIGGIVRTYGTFTSSAGETPFVGSLAAMLLTVWILPKDRRPLRGALLVLASVAVIACLAVSGSRGAFILAGLVLVSALASSLVMPQATMKSRAVLVPLIIVTVSAFLVGATFSDAWQALLARSLDAYQTESAIYSFGTVGRAFAGFTDFLPSLAISPFFGYGLGTFGNAFSLLYASSLPSTLSSESDWARNVLELGPLLGSLYVGLRVALVISLTRGAVIATRRLNNPMPLLLLGFSGILILQGQITGQGTVQGFGWLYAGFCMAANRLYSPREEIGPSVAAKQDAERSDVRGRRYQ